MILVPHETVARMNDTTPSAIQTQSSSLDSEMEKIMRDKKYADDSEKWKVYNQVLQRYLHFTKERTKPLHISLEGITQEEEDDDESGAMLRRQLSAALPKTYKAHALRIFDYLKQADSKITWDSAGTVSINSKPVPNSNIIDLISDLTRTRKNFEPVGLSNFIHALSSINFPLELVSNSTRRSDIISARNQSGSGLTVIRSTGRVVKPKTQFKKHTKKGNKKQIKKTIKRHGWKTW